VFYVLSLLGAVAMDVYGRVVLLRDVDALVVYFLCSQHSIEVHGVPVHSLFAFSRPSLTEINRDYHLVQELGVRVLRLGFGAQMFDLISVVFEDSFQLFFRLKGLILLSVLSIVKLLVHEPLHL